MKDTTPNWMRCASWLSRAKTGLRVCNHQSGKVNEELAEPFVISLLDEFSNPVVGHAVTFEMKDGNGYFSDSKRKVTMQTDDDGQVAAKYTLGANPGFNSVKVTTKNLKDSIEFQAMAQ